MQSLRQFLSQNSILYNPTLIQTSVAVIFNFEQVLLIKRKVSTKDIHSGQIAFPGGKLEIGENTLQAAIRETNEEIGLELTQQEHLGRMPNNYLAYYIKNKSLMMSAHLFEVNKPLNLKLNSEEVDRIYMLPLKEITMQMMEVKKYKNKSAHIFARYNQRQKYLSEIVMKDFKYQQFPYFKLEKQVFYGLSWLILCDVLKTQNTHQDVVNFTFQNYHYEFENNLRKEQFFDDWFKRQRLSQFMN